MKLHTSRSTNPKTGEDILSFKGEIDMDQFFEAANSIEVRAVRMLEEQGAPELALAVMFFAMSRASQASPNNARDQILHVGRQNPTENAGHNWPLAIMLNPLG